MSIPTTIPGAERVVAGARDSACACYLQQLQKTPDMEGRYAFILSIDATGRVLKVESSTTGSLSGGFKVCIDKVLRELTFSPPEPRGPETVSSIFTFAIVGRGK